MKTCKRCGETRPLADFYAHPGSPDGLKHICKTCYATASKERRIANPERTAESARKTDLKRHYGMTLGDLADMTTAQGGVCDICYRPNRRGLPLCVDHNHATGAVRALLCHPCNLAIGNMDDVPDRLRAAARYLELHDSTNKESAH